jgi:hypothetical protein
MGSHATGFGTTFDYMHYVPFALFIFLSGGFPEDLSPMDFPSRLDGAYNWFC